VTTDPFEDFDTPAPTPTGVLRRGRYHLPHLDGTHKPRGWMRVSNLVGAYSDQFALRLWELEQMARGVALAHELYVEAVDFFGSGPGKDEAREWTAEFMERVKRVSGGSAGADHGNARHDAVEGLHRGADINLQPAEVRRMLTLYASTLDRNGFVALPGMQERIVHVPELEVCGRLDNVLHQGGQNIVGDLKTQRRFWSFLEIGAQLAIYAHGAAMWDPATSTWVGMPPVRQDVAVVLWMPRGDTKVEVHGVDIVKGWKTAQRAYEVVLDRAEARSVKGGRAWLWPAPPMTVVERYAALWASVESMAEGRALRAEIDAQGLCGDPVLQDAGRKAFDRLTKNMVE
jgi:hypothetical protein